MSDVQKATTLLGSLDSIEPAAQATPAWLASLRSNAKANVLRTGLPTKKTEAFRFTPVKVLAETEYVPASESSTSSALPLGEPTPLAGRAWKRLAELHRDGTHRILLVDGVPSVEAAGTSNAPLPEGIEIHSIAEVLAKDPARLEPFLGRIAVPEFFGAINAALFTDGYVIVAKANAHVTTPIHIVHVANAGSAPAVAYPRIVVVAETGSDVSILETVLGRDEVAHLSNEVIEVFVGANAHVTHVAVHEAKSHHVVRQAVRLDRDARYDARSVTLGGGLLRVDLHVMFEGENSEVTLDGVYHVAGEDLVDHHVLVEHRVPRCRSRQRYRGIIDGHGSAVFDGIVHVHAGASKTEAHQENRNLLLSTSATVHTKPHLEIDTDDVVCSHGATVGSLDADQLFYLRARGVSESMARSMLTYAFVREILEGISPEPTRARLDAAFLARFPDGDALRELT